MRIRQSNHSTYQVEYHIIWCTKYRKKILKYYVKGELIRLLYKIQKIYPDWYYIKINTDRDHVHLLLEIPPKYAVAKVVQKLKIFTAKGLLKRFKFLRKIYEDGHLWSVGYFVSTVGVDEERIKKY
ncbi:MAG: hypothetical protein A2Y67_03260, partial [Candidatus Buchananbacteria bacterium RBG_13_39_9]